jgi:hypothetical protein
MILTRTNIFLGLVLITYLVICSKYIGCKNNLFRNQIYLLILLICVIIIYPYHQQAGITLLLIAMISNSPVFKEAYIDFMDGSTNNTNLNTLENTESNFQQTIEKRRQKNLDQNLEKQDPRMLLLEKEEIITPLEKEIVREVQRQFEEDIDLITTDNFNKLLQYTDEGDPINAGLIPKDIDPNNSGIDYNQLVRIGNVIKF